MAILRGLRLVTKLELAGFFSVVILLVVYAVILDRTQVYAKPPYDLVAPKQSLY